MKRILPLFFLIFSLPSISQEKKVENYYVDYFKLPRESLFLHTNKTSYITGEDIWFKVYAYDRRNHLSSKATKNIYLGIYDDAGKQVAKKLFLSKNGFAKGNINIDSSFTSGNYYIKASTNWMRNFKENDDFIQKIRIINPEKTEQEITKVFDKEYDFQLLPEGGHLLANTKNTIGIKMIDDNGLGTQSSGVIVDSTGKEVSQFTTNSLGLGKFSLYPLPSEKYIAKVILSNGKEFEQSLPITQKTGVTLQVNNQNKEDVIIRLATNEASLNQIKSTPFKLLIHKDGTTKIISIQFNDRLTEVVRISKDFLFKGVNIITLFNSEEKPILERMFFNDKNIFYKSLTVEKLKKEGDSISFTLKTAFKESTTFNASISVLPAGSISYNPKHNIISSFYLKPYIKGTIENPQYYFRKKDRKTAYELDVLLLTQGWSRYNWNDIFNSPPKKTFEFENGIVVKGHLNTNLKKVKSLLLYPTSNNESKFIEFDDKGKFSLTSFYPVKKEILKLSYIDKKGNIKKPGIAFNFKQNIYIDSINTKPFQTFESFYKSKNNITVNFFLEKREQLDEIVLNSKLDKLKRRKYRLPISRGKVTEITMEEVKKFSTVGDFLDFNGFTIIRTSSLRPRITSNRIRGSEDAQPPIFFLNQNEVKNVSQLIDRKLSDFEDIYVDTSLYTNNFGISRQTSDGSAQLESLGVGTAKTGFRSVVKLFERRNSLYNGSGINDTQNFTKVTYGFEPTKEFYTPQYASYKNATFTDYGVVHWIPEIIISNESSTNFKIIDTELEEISFHIEAIAKDGTILSQVIKLEAKKN